MGICNEKDYLHDLRGDKDVEILRDFYYTEASNLVSKRFDASDGVEALYLYNGEHELVSAITGMLSKSLIGPLERMTQTAKKIRVGNTKLCIEGMKDDEVGELAQSFNEMLDQIGRLTDGKPDCNLYKKMIQ